MSEPFTPSRYLSHVNGAAYLKVKWRLVWLRSVHPDAAIESELVSHGDGVAVFRARVILPPKPPSTGGGSLPRGGSATGYGSESAGDFRDYLEKAETKAIGRALAALGFGTQFCTDHDGPLPPAGGGRWEGGHRPTPDDDPAPEGQIRYLEGVGQKAGLSDEALEEQAMALFGVPVHALSRRHASHLAQVIRGRASEGSEHPTTTRPRRLAAVPDSARASHR